MMKSTPAGLAMLLFFWATVGAFVPLSAAHGNDAGSPEDEGGGNRTQWTIVATYPIPEGASGLAYDGSNLYCGIYGADGGRVYQIDPATGAYSLLFTGPHEDAYGLTYDGQYLWTTDHPGGSSTPAVAMKLDWSGNLLSQINLPDHYMSGIAHDSGNHWVSRYYPDPGHLYKVDPFGRILQQFDGPDNQPWDLAVENDHLWIADYWGDALYMLDRATGTLLETHPSEGVDPAGVVWDGQFLWYCDNGTGGVDYLYKVDLQGGGSPEINIPVTSHDYGTIVINDSVTWLMTVQNVGQADLSIDAVVFSPPTDLSCPAAFPVIIAPSGNAQLPMQYDPSGFGPLSATATVSSTDPVQPNVDITLTGHAVYPDPYIDLAEGLHDYGAVRVNANTRWLMQISNHGNATLTISDLLIDDAHFYLDDAVTLPLQIATLSSVEVGVWFSPDSGISYAATLAISSNDPYQNPTNVPLSGTGTTAPYPIGDGLWSYLIDNGYDNTPQALASIPDISGDGIADVIVCSEDDFVRCFNGNAHGTGDVLWEHEIYAGSVYSQNALQITEDIDGDGYLEVVVGSAWGGRLIRTISGKTGATVWTHDTHEYGNGGWVYDVDCTYDYNGDGVVDVLACAGDDADDTGPNRAYCLDGVTGISIWEFTLGGPVFAVIGVEDFTGDGQPDAVAGASNADETQGRAYGLDGANGSLKWTFIAPGSSVWALAQIDDITADGVRDVIVGDFSAGSVHGLDARTGGQQYVGGGFGLITRFEVLDDVNGDGHPDIVPGHLGTTLRVVDGQTGNAIWSKTLADKPSVVARIADLSGDGINDVVVGTLFSNNYAYFLDGVDGLTLHSINYGTPIDAIAAIPDIVGDGTMEMIVGGRNGLLTCYSGGVETDCNGNGVPDWQDIANGTSRDCDGDGIPDECGSQYTDIGLFIDEVLNAVPDPVRVCMYDQNGDDTLDGRDLPGFVGRLLE